jgi:hypothetical protein
VSPICSRSKRRLPAQASDDVLSIYLFYLDTTKTSVTGLGESIPTSALGPIAGALLLYGVGASAAAIHLIVARSRDRGQSCSIRSCRSTLSCFSLKRGRPHPFRWRCGYVQHVLWCLCKSSNRVAHVMGSPRALPMQGPFNAYRTSHRRRGIYRGSKLSGFRERWLEGGRVRQPVKRHTRICEVRAADRG